jgi:hypothetical protein
MKNLFFILLFLFGSLKAKTERLSVLPSLVSNLCQLVEIHRLEHAPRTRASTRVLPNRPPPELSLSPLEYLRLQKKTPQQKEEFLKKFWENFERQGGSRKEAEAEIAAPKMKVEEISSTCQLTSNDKKQLLIELKNK